MGVGSGNVPTAVVVAAVTEAPLPPTPPPPLATVMGAKAKLGFEEVAAEPNAAMFCAE